MSCIRECDVCDEVLEVLEQARDDNRTARAALDSGAAHAVYDVADCDELSIELESAIKAMRDGDPAVREMFDNAFGSASERPTRN